jgi:tRNA G26 N,N-dimethylase Trm1
MSATGIWAIRIKKEIENVNIDRITALDLKEECV